MRAYINGVGLLAPGLEGFEAGIPVLRGDIGWSPEKMREVPVDILPANERRRTSRLVKHALLVAQKALQSSDTRAAGLVSVFASSDGDTEIVNNICEALCQDEIFVSPTHFHNSVHNAPAGYWAIATGSHAPSTSLSAADGSFAAGLLESMVQIEIMQQDVLFVAFDHPPPPPLDKKRDIRQPFALALLLGRYPSSSSPSVIVDPDCCLCEHVPESQCRNDSLTELQRANPAARSLPLLECLCRSDSAELILPYEKEYYLRVIVDA